MPVRGPNRNAWQVRYAFLRLWGRLPISRGAGPAAGAVGKVAATHDPGAKRGFGTRLARSASQIKGDFPLVLLDLVLAAFTYLLLFGLRFDFSIPSSYWDQFRIFLPVACVLSVGSMWAWGCYGRTWRHASIDEAVRLLSAGACTGAVLILGFIWDEQRIPLAVLVAGPILATFLFGMVRFQQRLFAYRRTTYHGTGVRVAVVGAGTNG